MPDLKQNYQFFLDNRATLLKKYAGKFLVIKDGAVVSAYDTEIEAYNDASSKFKLGSFLIQQCVKKENRAVFNSRVTFV
jgi:hypothetical protein